MTYAISTTTPWHIPDMYHASSHAPQIAVYTLSKTKISNAYYKCSKTIHDKAGIYLKSIATAQEKGTVSFLYQHNDLCIFQIYIIQIRPLLNSLLAQMSYLTVPPTVTPFYNCIKNKYISVNFKIIRRRSGQKIII